MPTPIIQYQCCKCNQIYINEIRAINCENSHYILDDFIISKIGKHGYNSYFPDSIHVVNQKTDKIASYTFNHDQVIYKKSVKHRWSDSLDKIYKRQLYNHYGYRFDSGLFPNEEEDG